MPFFSKNYFSKIKKMGILKCFFIQNVEKCIVPFFCYQIDLQALRSKNPFEEYTQIKRPLLKTVYQFKKNRMSISIALITTN